MSPLVFPRPLAPPPLVPQPPASRAVALRRVALAAFAACASAAILVPAPLAATPPEPPFTVVEARGSGRPLARHWVDLDGDGSKDLVVVTGRSTTPLPAEEDRVSALVAWLRVTPSFLDRREVAVFRQTASGLQPWGAPLPLPGDCSALDVADLDGDGRPEILFSAGYRIYAFSRPPGSDAWPAEPKTLCDAEMLLGTGRAFVPAARLVLPGDSRARALLLSTTEGLEIRRFDAAGKAPAHPDLVLGDALRTVLFGAREVRVYDPLPRVVDADGDGTVDLLFRLTDRFAVYRGRGEGRFDATALSWPKDGKGLQGANLMAEDVDGDGLLDLAAFRSGSKLENGTIVPDVEFPPDTPDAQPAGAAQTAPGTGSATDAPPPASAPRPGEASPTAGSAAAGTASGGGDKGTKADSKSKGKRVNWLEVRRGRPGFAFSTTPDLRFDLPADEKYEDAEFELRKIDADRRLDIVAVRVSASLWQLARVMTTKKMTLGVSFQALLQRPDGSFSPPAGQPFETKLRIDLQRGIGSIPSGPEGDFNGDGVTDLVEFTEEPRAEIHLTGADGAFPARPDWSVPLAHRPDDRDLLDVEDLNGDGRSDAAFFTPDGDGFVVTLLRSRK